MYTDTDIGRYVTSYQYGPVCMYTDTDMDWYVT